ncbi:Elongation of very long chain fatty acids protein 2 [Galemys pyrenaicus]|uniref:Elongation of very long chain fatty acids protein n=1 Tax=Galemys pyrenaicus TaxID=202257 RepID=A0A8J5ZZE3_GALPY|nr:Elongation of very long chain fatty acids protein 2 [Galemys pyrenaicus]
MRAGPETALSREPRGGLASGAGGTERRGGRDAARTQPDADMMTPVQNGPTVTAVRAKCPDDVQAAAADSVSSISAGLDLVPPPAGHRLCWLPPQWHQTPCGVFACPRLAWHVRMRQRLQHLRLGLLADTRVRGWLLLDSYLPTFSLTILYLLSIWLGSKYMKHRPAFSLRGALTVYNLGVTLLSAYMLMELILSTWEGGYSLQCQDLASAGDADVRVARVLWWYYFSKSIEFLDTIFFVLRKKTSQITFLHVYHHASMFNIWWCVLNWIPCGQSFFGPTLNSFIHILMYSYYGLSVFPSMHKYLWWKKYLTQAQLVGTAPSPGLAARPGGP